MSKELAESWIERHNKFYAQLEAMHAAQPLFTPEAVARVKEDTEYCRKWANFWVSQG